MSLSYQFRMSKRSLEHWLSEYAVSHQNLINKKIHWLCVPTIFVSILGMGMSLSVWFTLVLSALVLPHSQLKRDLDFNSLKLV